MNQPLPSPERHGYEQADEQLAYYRGAMAGKTAAELLVGHMLAEEHYNATHDHMTGALNRAGFEEVLSMIKPDDLKDYAVLYADNDNTKAVNDLISHKRGDEMIIETASVLFRSLRKDDVLARIGGDEFLALIYVGQNNSERPASLIAASKQTEGARARIDAEMRAVLDLNTDVEIYGYGLSVGVAYPTTHSTIESLKTEAELEMRTVKTAHHEERPAYREIVA